METKRECPHCKSTNVDELRTFPVEMPNGETLADRAEYLCNECHRPFGILSNKRPRGMEVLAANKKLITRITDKEK